MELLSRLGTGQSQKWPTRRNAFDRALDKAMSDRTTRHETVSGSAEDSTIELSSHDYGYLGKDTKGFHYHLDKATDTIYATTTRADRFHPENAGEYWVRIPPDLERGSVTLEQPITPSDLERAYCELLEQVDQ